MPALEPMPDVDEAAYDALDKQLHAAFAANAIEVFAPEPGDAFDPATMEALRAVAPPTSVASVAVWAGAGPLARRYGHSRHLRCEAALRAHRWRLSAGQLRRRGPAREWRTTGGEQA